MEKLLRRIAAAAAGIQCARRRRKLRLSSRCTWQALFEGMCISASHTFSHTLIGSPQRTWVVRPWKVDSALASTAICAASSRVGEMTRMAVSPRRGPVRISCVIEILAVGSRDPGRTDSSVMRRIFCKGLGFRVKP